MARQRPPSSASRNAWSDDGIDNPAHVPAAMEGEDYDGGVRHIPDRNAVGTREPQDGCWQKFKRGVRSLWATRMTEETTENRELYIKTTLRELILYLIFLTTICIVTFGMTGTILYYYTKVMTELFVDADLGDGNTFRGMTTMRDFWSFAEGPLLDGLYWEEWYNGQNVSEDELGYIYYENKLLGVPRMRQLKVRNDSCSVHEDFQNEIQTCFYTYAESLEDRNPFGPYEMNATDLMTKNAWYYQTESELGGSSHWGRISTYQGGGFVQDLGLTKAFTAQLITELKENLWLDRGTRAVFVDFTVYNANINLFSVIRLLVEFPATGGAIPSWSVRTVKLIRYVTAFDYFVMACECLFVLFILYYIVEESIEVKKHKLSYFKSFWNILDILVIIIAICCLAFNIYRSLAVGKKLDELLGNQEMYADFESLSYWQIVFNSAIAVMVFFAWVKLFKYISFNKTMTQLSSTLARCAKDLVGFAIMFFIIFLAFAQLGYLLFGTQVKDFSSFGNSIFTLFRIILGDFNFHDLEQANRILGPAYFILYVFFVFFVLLNMFLAIINDTYAEVKAEIATQKNEFEMADYFKQGYNKMLEKLNIKRDKIVDIQKALQTADINNDKQLDFDEWRQDLKTRGYADAEIEAVFAKYDADGDRVLDAGEQRRMHDDLEGQKDALNKEYDHLKGKDSRPGTSAGRPGSSLENGSDSEEDDSSVSRKGGSSRMGVGGGGGIGGGVAQEDFQVLKRRVDRMEHSIGSIVSKIDAVLIKLEAMERNKSKRRETMTKILDSITEAESMEGDKRGKMEKLVREELERWDSESSLGQGSTRALSPLGSAVRPGGPPGGSSGGQSEA